MAIFIWTLSIYTVFLLQTIAIFCLNKDLKAFESTAKKLDTDFSKASKEELESAIQDYVQTKELLGKIENKYYSSKTIGLQAACTYLAYIAGVIIAVISPSIITIFAGICGLVAFVLDRYGMQKIDSVYSKLAERYTEIRRLSKYQQI